MPPCAFGPRPSAGGGYTCLAWVVAFAWPSAFCTVTTSRRERRHGARQLETSGRRDEYVPHQLDQGRHGPMALQREHASRIAHQNGTRPGQGRSVLVRTEQGPLRPFRHPIGPPAVHLDGLDPAAVHVLKVRLTGRKSKKSSASNVIADGFANQYGALDQEMDAVRFDRWRGAGDECATWHHYRFATAAGSRATYRFSGTEVDWVTTECPVCGKVRVFIDGNDMGTLDLYTPEWGSDVQPRTRYAYRGLQAGPHVISVGALGTKNANWASTRVDVDGSWSDEPWTWPQFPLRFSPVGDKAGGGFMQMNELASEIAPDPGRWPEHRRPARGRRLSVQPPAKYPPQPR
jgi:hypothetical protein